jgi:hypothetical protein
MNKEFREDYQAWNGHAWAMRLYAEKIGPMSDLYDSYSAQFDLDCLKLVIEHAQWLKASLEAQKLPNGQPKTL